MHLPVAAGQTGSTGRQHCEERTPSSPVESAVSVISGRRKRLLQPLRWSSKRFAAQAGVSQRGLAIGRVPARRSTAPSTRKEVVLVKRGFRVTVKWSRGSVSITLEPY